MFVLLFSPTEQEATKKGPPWLLETQKEEKLGMIITFLAGAAAAAPTLVSHCQWQKTLSLSREQNHCPSSQLAGCSCLSASKLPGRATAKQAAELSIHSANDDDSCARACSPSSSAHLTCLAAERPHMDPSERRENFALLQTNADSTKTLA